MSNKILDTITKIEHLSFLKEKSSYAKARLNHYKREIEKGMHEDEAVKELKYEFNKYLRGVNKSHMIYNKIV